VFELKKIFLLFLFEMHSLIPSLTMGSFLQQFCKTVNDSIFSIVVVVAAAVAAVAVAVAVAAAALVMVTVLGYNS
jgi:hypothetical protein